MICLNPAVGVVLRLMMLAQKLEKLNHINKGKTKQDNFMTIVLYQDNQWGNNFVILTMSHLYTDSFNISYLHTISLFANKWVVVTFFEVQPGNSQGHKKKNNNKIKLNTSALKYIASIASLYNHHNQSNVDLHCRLVTSRSLDVSSTPFFFFYSSSNARSILSKINSAKKKTFAVK